MQTFSIHFLTSNFIITFIIGFILVIRRLLGRHLTVRMQYCLWFPLLALLAVPFFPVRFSGFADLISRCLPLSSPGIGSFETHYLAVPPSLAPAPLNWMNDFAESVSRSSVSLIGNVLFLLWITGVAIMLLRFLSSLRQLSMLKQSALPIQDNRVLKVYRQCIQEIQLSHAPIIYATTQFQSPAIAGLFQPRIYLPETLASCCDDKELRFVLLHELQHYHHRDHWINFLTAFVQILYWLHPLVWFAFSQMKNDQELSCDASVLQMLEEHERQKYGYTLLQLAESISHHAFWMVSGIGGSSRQTKVRIEAIANYRDPSRRKRIGGRLLYGLSTAFLLCFSPFLAVSAHEADYYDNAAIFSGADSVSFSDYESLFEGFDGSFVLYDTRNRSWNIYNEKLASTRISPDSTYKIYDALLGLENRIITPQQSDMTWDGEIHSFETWNQDQTLRSAMANSVNWYFQTIDQAVGQTEVEAFLGEIKYGNEQVNGNLASYWMESSLKISPLEQVVLLDKFYNNEFHFAPENIQAVKDALLLESTPQSALYGKTGTGQIEGKNCNGWFVGYVERDDTPYFFALNIQGEDACGSTAAQVATEILARRGLWG